MKFRKFFLSIGFLALMIAIWCMTPPQINLIIKITCTTPIVGYLLISFLNQYCRSARYAFSYLRHIHHLCLSVFRHIGHACIKVIINLMYITAWPFKTLGHLLIKFFSSNMVDDFQRTCNHGLRWFGDFTWQSATNFANWSFQANSELIQDQCLAIIEHSNHDRRSLRFLRYAKNWYNFTSFFCCVAVSVIGMTLYDQLILQIILAIFNTALSYYGIYVSFSALVNVAKRFDSTEPSFSVICIIIQFCLPFFLILNKLSSMALFYPPTEITSIQAYFTIHFGTRSFGLTIPQAIAITSTLLALIGYGNFCAAVHDIAYPPDHQHAN